MAPRVSTSPPRPMAAETASCQEAGKRATAQNAARTVGTTYGVMITSLNSRASPPDHATYSRAAAWVPWRQAGNSATNRAKVGSNARMSSATTRHKSSPFTSGWALKRRAAEATATPPAMLRGSWWVIRDTSATTAGSLSGQREKYSPTAAVRIAVPFPAWPTSAPHSDQCPPASRRSAAAVQAPPGPTTSCDRHNREIERAMSAGSMPRTRTTDCNVAIVNWVSSVYWPRGKPSNSANSVSRTDATGIELAQRPSNGAPRASPTAPPRTQPRTRSARCVAVNMFLPMSPSLRTAITLFLLQEPTPTRRLHRHPLHSRMAAVLCASGTRGRFPSRIWRRNPVPWSQASLSARPAERQRKRPRQAALAHRGPLPLPGPVALLRPRWRAGGG